MVVCLHQVKKENATDQPGAGPMCVITKTESCENRAPTSAAAVSASATVSQPTVYMDIAADAASVSTQDSDGGGDNDIGGDDDDDDGDGEISAEREQRTRRSSSTDARSHAGRSTRLRQTGSPVRQAGSPTRAQRIRGPPARTSGSAPSVLSKSSSSDAAAIRISEADPKLRKR